jgi:phage baseplate assembly protein W
MAKFFGYNIPFFGGGNQWLSRHIDEKLVRRDLLQLLLTSPGHRVMRPNYGTEIRSYLFDPADQGAVDMLKNSIKKAVETYERRVNITDVVVTRGSDENILNIKVYGTYNLDRFTSPNMGDADLLVQLELDTGKVHRLE